MLDRLEDTPALVLSALGETLIANRLALALLGDIGDRVGLERYEAWRWFTLPDGKSRYPEGDRDRQSRSLVANLRAACAMSPHGQADALVRALTAASPEFAALWARHEVARRFADHKTLIHPEIGPIDVDCQVLFTEDQSQSLLVLTPAPRLEAEQKLELLRVIGMQHFDA